MKNKFLFKNCINNNVAVFIQFENQNKAYITKSTFFKDSYDELKNEYNGFKWYSKYRDISVSLLKNHKFNHYQLKIEYIKGSKIKYKLGLVNNYERVLSSIKYYNSIIETEYALTKKYPLHGDFSLDNIIFNKNNISIIDWQHFTLLDSYRGFDILNLIFEQFYFDYYKSRLFFKRKKMYLKLLALIKYTFSHTMIDNYFFASPLMKTRMFINSNKEKIWNNQTHKLPVIKFTNKDVSFIDNYINLNIK
tara:strand:+ start:22294 stop:23040 length:747 start_codon:yes stop_codon:yes gene_type:complete